jgi:hypothetical protein
MWLPHFLEKKWQQRGRDTKELTNKLHKTNITHEFVLQEHHPNLQTSQAVSNKLALADELSYGLHGCRGEDEAARGLER